VIDTNVLVSGLLSPAGNKALEPHPVVLAALPESLRRTGPIAAGISSMRCQARYSSSES
jgi:hypothetical protein